MVAGEIRRTSLWNPVFLADVREMDLVRRMDLNSFRLSRDSRVVALLACVVVMSLADLAFTLTFMTTTGLPEMNPVVRALATVCTEGTAIVLWKIGSVAVCVGLLFAVRNSRTGELGSLLAVMVLVWLTARWDTFIDTAYTLEPFLAEFQATDAEWVMLGTAR